MNFEAANSDFTALYGIKTSANVRYLKGISGVLQKFIRESDLHHDSTKNPGGCPVESRRSFRFVSKGKHKARHQRPKIYPFDDDRQYLASIPEQFLSTQRSGKDLKHEEEVSNSEPGEDHVN